MGTPPSAEGRERAAIAAMKQHGLRVTSPRLLVLRALYASPQPLNAQQVHNSVRQAGGHIDVVTVYRILAAFQEIGLVHFIGVAGGYAACSLDECHESDSEHAICESCGRVLELQIPTAVRQEVTVPLDKLGFEARSVRVEVLGQCDRCAAS
jgi:Fe2+ or Zn2+ uptake regulation protein